MLTGILIFIGGTILGLIIGVALLNAPVGCEIHVVQTEEEKPYLYLAINKSLEYLSSKKYVLAEIKKDDYNSQK